VTAEDLEEAAECVERTVELVRTTREEMAALSMNIIAFRRDVITMYNQLTQLVEAGLLDVSEVGAHSYLASYIATLDRVLRPRVAEPDDTA
jgi:hypothetical protein